MAKITNHKSTVFFNLVSILFFVLMVSMAESRVVGKVAVTNGGLVCNNVVAVKNGDTCFSIANQFQLTAEDFNFINPNLNCDALFVGQWLCLAGGST